MITRRYPVYKGLEKPLTFRGFKGKFIYWGLASLLVSLVFGALTIALVNMFLGVLVLGGSMTASLLVIAGKQKKGIYSKTRFAGILIHPVNYRKIRRYGKEKI